LISEYECPKCKDIEFVIDPNTKAARFCECRETKRYKRILESSGISEAFSKKTLNEYKPKNKLQTEIKQMAVNYITNFNTIRAERNNSLALTGQVGSGKTHITIAIANALMKQNIGVLYMQYREVITLLKQLITDEESYSQEINKYKNATVLLIDDLFKGSMRNGKIPESDLSIKFDIINYRYLKQSPILVSSEFNIERIIEFDEATGSRIGQMCSGRIMNLTGKELNNRIPQ
jgi:DNA replication protein DnaC